MNDGAFVVSRETALRLGGIAGVIRSFMDFFGGHIVAAMEHHDGSVEVVPDGGMLFQAQMLCLESEVAERLSQISADAHPFVEPWDASKRHLRLD